MQLMVDFHFYGLKKKMIYVYIHGAWVLVLLVLGSSKVCKNRINK